MADQTLINIKLPLEMEKLLLSRFEISFFYH